ncbi:discoidin domain-containing protein [Nonomuraea ferruginea]|uniref:discoidin domain-containing protein n=1 Tax=Nonomuraea ferruginea TaxID=46174 RepID=UPI0036218FD5
MVPSGASAAVADPLVSQGRPVTASSVEAAGLEPDKAVDGNASTRWASAEGVDPQWIRVDLGAAHAISRVRLTWEVAHARAYRVQTSPDGSTWSDVYSTASGDGGDRRPHGQRQRPVRAGVRHAARHPVGLLPLGAGGLRDPREAAAAAPRSRPTGSCGCAASSSATRTASRSSCAA